MPYRAAPSEVFSFDQTDLVQDETIRFGCLSRRTLTLQVRPSIGGAQNSSEITEENRMSKTCEHYHHAAPHHERAAYHYKEAAKYDQASEHEKAAHNAYLAHGHSQHAAHYDAETAKLHAEHCEHPAVLAAGPEADKRGAA
jgi:hypothetical protein